MSINLQNDLVKIFVDEVKHIFQNEGGDLMGSCREKFVEGDRAQFPVLGSMITQERTLGTKLPIQNKDHTPVEVVVQNFTGSAMVDNFLNSQTNFDDRQETARSLAMALARRMDQFKINALDASTTTKTVANNISGSVDNLTFAAIREAARLLDEDGVPSEGRWLAVSPSGLHHLFQDDQASSADFQDMKRLATGDVKTGMFYGFNIAMIGNRPNEGGLPLVGADRTSFAWHRDALGMVVNTNMSVTIDRLPEFDADLVTGRLSAGSREIDPLGIVTIATDES